MHAHGKMSSMLYDTEAMRWRDDAKCKGYSSGTDSYFYEGRVSKLIRTEKKQAFGNGPGNGIGRPLQRLKDQVHAATTLCAVCPVQQQCLEQAQEDPSALGLYGGHLFMDMRLSQVPPGTAVPKHTKEERSLVPGVTRRSTLVGQRRRSVSLLSGMPDIVRRRPDRHQP